MNTDDDSARRELVRQLLPIAPSKVAPPSMTDGMLLSAIVGQLRKDHALPPPQKQDHGRNTGTADGVVQEMNVLATRSKAGPSVPSRAMQDLNPELMHYDAEPIPSRETPATPRPSKQKKTLFIDLVETEVKTEVKSEMADQKVGKARESAESHQASHGAAQISPKEQRGKGGKRTAEDRNKATKVTANGGRGSNLRNGRPGSQQTVASSPPPTNPRQWSEERGRSPAGKKKPRGSSQKRPERDRKRSQRETETTEQLGREMTEQLKNEATQKRGPGKDKKKGTDNKRENKDPSPGSSSSYSYTTGSSDERESPKKDQRKARKNDDRIAPRKKRKGPGAERKTSQSKHRGTHRNEDHKTASGESSDENSNTTSSNKSSDSSDLPTAQNAGASSTNGIKDGTGVAPPSDLPHPMAIDQGDVCQDSVPGDAHAAPRTSKRNRDQQGKVVLVPDKVYGQMVTELRKVKEELAVCKAKRKKKPAKATPNVTSTVPVAPSGATASPRVGDTVDH